MNAQQLIESWDILSNQEYSEVTRLLQNGEIAKMKQSISCPLTTEQYQPHDVENAKKLRRLLIRGRELYIMRRKNQEG
jgi:hypothetical protein